MTPFDDLLEALSLPRAALAGLSLGQLLAVVGATVCLVQLLHVIARDRDVKMKPTIMTILVLLGVTVGFELGFHWGTRLQEKTNGRGQCATVYTGTPVIVGFCAWWTE